MISYLITKNKILKMENEDRYLDYLIILMIFQNQSI